MKTCTWSAFLQKYVDNTCIGDRRISNDFGIWGKNIWLVKPKHKVYSKKELFVAIWKTAFYHIQNMLLNKYNKMRMAMKNSYVRANCALCLEQWRALNFGIQLKLRGSFRHSYIRKQHRC